MGQATATDGFPLATARREAEAFRKLFDGLYERWEIAGSIRRGRRLVKDIDHVIIPKVGAIPGRGLFGDEGNLVFAKLDELAGIDGPMQKHTYGAQGFRWGEKMRGVDFGSFKHEVWCATPDTWGAGLVIRTGPAEFSKYVVTGLLQQGFRNHRGMVWRCKRCHCDGRNKLCETCEGYGLIAVETVAAETEEAYFKLAGVDVIAPEKRDEFVEQGAL